MANISRSRKSGFTLRGGVMRRESMWIGLAGIAQTIAAGTPVLYSSLAARILALRPFTVVRTRGIFFIRSDQTAADESYAVSLAHCVVTAQAVAIGVTAIPTPVTDIDSDSFYVYESATGRFDVTGAPGQFGLFGTFDSKAMRKVEDGFDLIGVMEPWTGFAGAVVNTTDRTLIKLH